MAGGEGPMATTTEPKLSKQDLSTLDVTKLTPLSPEVISNQATINIGTIGHVAHGKSTVVKALSGVQTVRFKNELERNITIKLGKQETKMQSAVEDVEMPVEGEIALPCDDGLPTETAGGRGVEEAGYVLRKQKNIRKKRKDLSSSHDETEDEYEVERILDYEYDYDKHWYFVKWKGWKSKYNSWEPLDHLANSQALVEEFHRKARENNLAAKRKRDARKLEMETIFNLHAEINLPRDVLEKHLKKYDGFPDFPPQDAMEKLFLFLKRRPIDKKLTRFHPVLGSWALAKAREEQLSKLVAWEKEINQKCTDPAPITVFNDVDLEGPPDNFNYINHYLPFTDVVIPSEPIFGCACGDVCSPRKGCCPSQAGTSFAYSSKKQLKLEPGQPIYECNSRCSCLSSCPNRVVQLGRQYPLCIFRTSNGCGWGVRAVSKIPKSSFVCEYVGEVITNDEAERRGREYDLEGRTYLFDLDYNQIEESECIYTVDAAKNGNVSHFINHSCDPNLQVYAVWIDCLDPNLPRLGLFSSRDIAAGEEVTFDYSPHQRHGRVVKHTVKQQCKCGSKMCKKVFLW